MLARSGKRQRKQRRSFFLLETLESRLAPTTYNWAPTAAGTFDWNNPANWAPNTGFPKAADDVANVTSALAGNETINLNVAVQVGTLNIGASSGASAFTLAAGSAGSLTIAVSSGTGSIVKAAGGNDQITAPMTATKDFNISNSGTSPLVLAGVLTGKALAINPTGQTGEVDFTGLNALNTANITVSGGALGINTLTLNASRTITITAGAVVKSSGTLNLNAQGSATYPDAVSGAGTLKLTSTTNSAASPDIFFNPNDSDSNNNNYGNRISANIDLGSSQRYIFARTNHGSFGIYGQSADAVISGAISGSGGITLIGQNNRPDMEVPLILGGANTFTGMLEIQRGSVYLNNPAALAQGNSLLMDPAAGNIARLFLWGNNATVSNLASSGLGLAQIANGNLGNPKTDLAAATLTVNEKTASTFGGQLLDFFHEYNNVTGSGLAGNLSLVVGGTSALTLTADYDTTGSMQTTTLSLASGTVTVNGGALLVNNTPTANTDTGLPLGNIAVNANGTLGGTGTIVPGATSTISINAGGTLGGLLTITGPVTDSGGVRANGNSATGLLTMGDLTLAGTSTVTADLNGPTLGIGYDRVVSTGVTLNGATLVVNPNFVIPANAAFDILASNIAPGTFKSAPEGSTVTFGGQSFTITYQGGSTGHDVVLTRVPPPVLYVDSAFAGKPDGTTIADADPAASGNQSATIGTTAFATVNAAIAKAAALSTVVVNGKYTGGGTGTFSEDVNINKPISLLIQAGPVSFGSLTASVPSALVMLGADLSGAATTLTVGGSNASGVFQGLIAGAGNLAKAGTGTMTLAGIDTYSGTTTVTAGTLQAGSPQALSFASAFTVNGDLAINGFNNSVAALAGTGTVENANATPAMLTVNVPSAGSSFTGVIRDGTGGGALSLVVTGAGAFTVGNANTYTGSTTIAGGSTLSAGTLAKGGSPSSIGASAKDTGNLVLQGGTLVYTGSTASSDRGFTLGAGGGTLTNSTSGSTLTISGNIANSINDLTLGGAGNLSFGGVFTGSSGALIDNGPGNVTFTSATAFGSANSPTTYGSITTGNITVNSGDLTLVNVRVSTGYRPGGVRGISIGSGAILTATGTVVTDPDGGTYVTQIAGPGTLQLRNASASKSNPSLTSDFGPNGGDAGPWGTVISAVIDVGATGTQVVVGKTNRNDVSRYAGDLRFDNSVTGSANLQVIGTNTNNSRNFHFVLKADNSGANGVAPFTGGLLIANADVALADNNALTAANSVTFDNAVDGNTTNTGVLYLYGHSVTIGSVNDTSAAGTTAFIRNGALDAQDGGTNSNHNGATNNAALGVKADSVLTINQTTAGTFNGNINDGPNDNGSGAAGVYRTLSIVKAGTATLTMNGKNGYTGSTTISGGVLAASSLANGGSFVSTVTAASESGTTVTITTSTPHGLLLGQGVAVSGVGTGYDGTYVITAVTPTTLTYTATATGLAAATSGQVFATSLAFGTGSSPSGIGSSSGDAANLVLDGGTLKYTGPATNSDRLFTVTGKGGTIDASGAGALTFTNPGSVVFSGTGTSTLTLAGTSTASNTLTAVLGNASGGTTAVVKSGAGAWDLTGNNTYTGPTTVNAGTLLIDGKLASPVTVAAGATLAGAGTLTGAVAVSGSLDAGSASSIGTLTVGNLSFPSGGALNAVINGASATEFDQIIATGTIDLTGAALNLSATTSFDQTTGITVDILTAQGGAITGTFVGAPEGGTVHGGGNLYTITYKGGATGHDVVLTRIPSTYVDGAWAALANGTAIADADPIAPGSQPATIGMNAFATVNAAIAATPNFDTLVVNGAYTGGGSGIFHEDVNVNKAISLLIQAGPVTFDSLAANSTDSIITLGVDKNNAPVTLTTGGDNASTAVAASISGGGNLVKTGTGAMTLSGNDIYSGATTITAGTIQAGSATGLSPSSAYTVNGTLTLSGFGGSIASLTGSGTVQNANATAAKLTVGVPAAGSTFSGVLQDGAGGGALSVVVKGTGAMTLAGTTNSYTGGTTVGSNLKIAALANAGSPSSIGASAKDPANFVLQGGVTLTYTGGAGSTDRGLTIGTGGATILVSTAAATLTIGGDIANATNDLTLGGAGNLSLGGVFTGTTGRLTVSGPGNASFTNPLAFGSVNDANTTGTITTGDVTVNGGDLTLVNLRLNGNSRGSALRALAISAGAIVTATGTVAIDPNGDIYQAQIAGPGTLQLRNASSTKANPSLTYDFGPGGGDGGPWGAVVTATVDVGPGTQWVVGKPNRNDVSRYAGDLRLDGPLTGSGALQVAGTAVNGGRNFHFVINHDNSGAGGAPAFTGSILIANVDVALADNNALTAANAVTFDGQVDANTTNTNVLYLFGHSVTIGSLNDTSDSGTTSFIRNGALDATNGGTNSNNNGATGGVALGAQADSVLTINQTTAGTFNGKINDGPNDNGGGAGGSYRSLSIVKTGTATLTLAGNNAYSGSTTISGGTLSVTSLANGGTSPKNGIGDSPSGIGSSTSDAANLVLDGGTLQYTGAATSTDRLFTVTGKGGTLDASGSGAVTFSATSPVIFSGAGDTTLTLTGTSPAKNTLAAAIVDGTGKTSIVKSGAGTWDLAGTESYTGATKVNAGALLVDGTLASSVTVASGATLAGSGTIAAPVAVSGALSAGDAAAGTGKLTVGNLSFTSGGSYNPVLGGATAGTGYDQVTGAGTLSVANASLNVSVASGFTPAVGSTFDVLVSNSAPGTFSGLAEGATFSVGGNSFKISYLGGTSGHDVVLTTQTPVGPSQLAISNLSPTSVAAGGAVTFTVTAQDSGGHTVPNYTGTVQLTSTDSAATYNGNPLPATYTFVAADNGAHTFTVKLNTPGSPTISIADQANSGLKATTNAITVTTAGGFSKYVLAPVGSSSLVAGAPFLVTVQAADATGTPVTNYTGPASVTVAASPADPHGTFPQTVALNSSGFGFFVGNLQTAGAYTLTATGGTVTGTSGNLTVAPSDATYLTVSAPATATTGTPVNVVVTAFDHFGNVATGYTGSVKLTSTDPAAATLVSSYAFTSGSGKDNGVHTFSATLKSGGTQTITATDTVSTNPTITGTSSPITTRGLTVTGFTPTPTGFTVTFSKPIVNANVSLYGGTTASPIHNVALVGKTTATSLGPVNGIFVIDPSGASATFKASSDWLANIAGQTDGLLPNDTWSVTLQSGTGTGSSANGFFDALSAPLDGGNNGGHANYTTTFVTSNDGKTALTIPDFARGPDGASAIKVPSNSAKGIPVTLAAAAAGTKDVVFTLHYNPALLTVTGASTGDSSGTGSTFTAGTPANGAVTFTWHNGTGLSGDIVLGDVVANVPNSAANLYRSKELLTIDGITVNGTALTLTSPAVHINAYFGDLSGDGQITGLDLANASNVAAGTPTSPVGLAAYKLVDPGMIGDIGGNGSIDSAAISSLAGYLAHVATPAIPTPPSGLTIAPGGPDPVLSLAVSQVSGGIVNVPVLLDHARPDGSTGMTEAIIGLTYDPKALSVSSSDITLGSLPASGSGWRLVSVVDAATGQIAIDLYSTTAITQAQAGSLVNIAFHSVSGAYVPVTAVQLVSSVTPQGHWYATEVVDAQDKFVLSPGVDQIMIPTGAALATPVSTMVVAPISAEHARLDILPSIEDGISLLGAEMHDGLAVISNGSLASEMPQAANVVVTGALAFQQNAVSVVPQQLVDRAFLALARWADAPTDQAPDVFVGAAESYQSWLVCPTLAPAFEGQSDSLQPHDTMANQQVVSERISVVDKLFAQFADETNDFGDFGDN
jgi:autotransporter-associated beta strand protein